MTALLSTKAKRGRPRKVVSTQTEQVKHTYFGKDLTIKDAFDAIARLEQRIVKLEKKYK